MPATAKKTATKKAAPKADIAEDVMGFGNMDAFRTVEDMTAAAREQFEAMMTTFTGNAEDMREQTQELAEEMRARFEKTQKQMTEVNAGLVEAARGELSDAVQFANEIVRVKSVSEAMELQRAYWTNLFETRVARAQELTATTVELAKENMEPVETGLDMFAGVKAFQDFFRFPAKA